MKPQRHFTTNVVSGCFTSVALECKPNTHTSSDNSAYATAICLHNCAMHTDIIHAAFANRKDNTVAYWVAKLL